jgi:hypothetical protein
VKKEKKKKRKEKKILEAASPTIQIISPDF